MCVLCLDSLTCSSQIDAAYERTLELMREKREEVAAIAELLLLKETITHDDIVEAIGHRPFTVSYSCLTRGFVSVLASFALSLKCLNYLFHERYPIPTVLSSVFWRLSRTTSTLSTSAMLWA